MRTVGILVSATFVVAACQPATVPASSGEPVVPPMDTPTRFSTAATPPYDLAPTSPPTEEAASVSTQVSEADGMTQLLVYAGTVIMGGVDVYADNDELPPHLVRIDAFWIDQVEVTNGMHDLCVENGACIPPPSFRSDDRASYYNDEQFRDYPVVNVSWSDAEVYCAWAGRRLPTEAEWERAARGDDMRTYPWGDEPPDEQLANFNNVIGDTSRVGTFARGASPFGALDMAGNVWEWVADRYKWNYYTSSPDANASGPDSSSGIIDRVLRGGSFQDPRISLRIPNRGHEAGPNDEASAADPARSGQRSVKIGFRCAMDN